MIRKIDNKYILDTVKRDDKNGYVFVKFGVYEDRLENFTFFKKKGNKTS